MTEYGFQQLDISYRHASEVTGLPMHHRDPFDRLLIAQALVEDLPIVSHDSAFSHYPVSRIWGRRFPKDGQCDMEHPRLTGPIVFVRILLHTWRLGQTDAIPLLGLEETDRSYADDLLSGRVELQGHDIKERIAYLFRIRKTLSALFRDEEIENEWLREPHDALDGQNPMTLLLEGSMENLLLVKEYVEAAAGRYDYSTGFHRAATDRGPAQGR